MQKGDIVFKITYYNSEIEGCFYILQNAKNSEKLVTRLITKLRKNKKDNFIIKSEVGVYDEM